MMSCLHSNKVYVAKLEFRTGKGAHLIRNFSVFNLMPAAIPVIVLFNYALLVTVVPETSEEGKLYEPTDKLWTISNPFAATTSGWLAFFFFLFVYKGVSVA